MAAFYKRMLDAMLQADQVAEPWHVYIVECNDQTFYTGIAKDARQRIEKHNTGKGARYTRSRRPVRLRYLETQPDRASALMREYQIKTLTRTAKQKLIEANEGTFASVTQAPCQK
jgi:predicted GIY-YIG superfamily endonuclease